MTIRNQRFSLLKQLISSTLNQHLIDYPTPSNLSYQCHFDENIISIQALATRNVRYEGKSEQSVYPIYHYKDSKLSFSPKLCNTVSTSSSLYLWHTNLVTHKTKFLKFFFQVLSLLQIISVQTMLLSCIHCLYGKMHKLQLTMSLPTSLIFLFLSPTLVKRPKLGINTDFQTI